MKIPKELSLAEKNILLVVTGKQEAKFFSIKNNTIELIDIIKISNPKYSDDEGFFMKQSHGSIISATNFEKRDAKPVIREFLTVFRERIKKIQPSYLLEDIYLFTPANMKNIIINQFPTKTKHNIKHLIEGNFFYRHPLDLIKKIKFT